MMGLCYLLLLDQATKLNKITAINVTKEKGNHHSDHHTFQIISCYWVQSNEYTAYGFQILFNLNLHLKQNKFISDLWQQLFP